MHGIKVHFSVSRDDNIRDAFGSEGFVRSSGWKIADHLFNDRGKYQDSVEAVENLKNLYSEGVDKLHKIRSRLPNEVVEAFDGFVKNKVDETSMKQVMASHGYDANDVYELNNTLEYYRMDLENTKRVGQVLGIAVDAHKEAAKAEMTETQKAALKKMVENAVHAAFYDKEKFNYHIRQLREFKPA